MFYFELIFSSDFECSKKEKTSWNLFGSYPLLFQFFFSIALFSQILFQTFLLPKFWANFIQVLPFGKTQVSSPLLKFIFKRYQYVTFKKNKIFFTKKDKNYKVFGMRIQIFYLSKKITQTNTELFPSNKYKMPCRDLNLRKNWI